MQAGAFGNVNVELQQCSNTQLLAIFMLSPELDYSGEQ